MSASVRPGPPSRTSTTKPAAGCRRARGEPLRHLDDDGSAGGCHPQGVLEQAVDELPHSRGIRCQPSLLDCGDVGEGHPDGGAPLGPHRLDLAAEGDEVGALRDEARLVGAEPREVEQVTDEPLEPARLGEHDPPTRAVSSGGTTPLARDSAYPLMPVSGVRRSCDTESRKSRWRPSERVSELGQGVEGARDLGHLGRPLDRDSDVAAAGREGVRGIGRAAQGAGEAPGHGGADRDRDRRGDGEGEQDATHEPVGVCRRVGTPLHEDDATRHRWADPRRARCHRRSRRVPTPIARRAGPAAGPGSAPHGPGGSSR